MAKWIFDDFDEMGRHYHCSKCGYGIMVKENLRDWTPNKCSNCRTEMKTRESRAIDAESLKDKLNDVYGDSNNLVYLYSALDLIDEQPTLTPPNEWVSVEERLPKYNIREDGELVSSKILCYCETDKTVHLAVSQKFYTGRKGEIVHPVFRYYDEWGDEIENVSHWMPLPKSPKEDE